MLRTPLIDMLWLFLSSSQEECSVLTRRALLSVGTRTRISVGNLDDLVTPRLFRCEAGCTRALGTSSREVVRQAVVAGCAFHSVAAHSRLCVDHLTLQRVGPSAHFVVLGSTPSSLVAERHARH